VSSVKEHDAKNFRYSTFFSQVKQDHKYSVPKHAQSAEASPITIFKSVTKILNTCIKSFHFWHNLSLRIWRPILGLSPKLRLTTILLTIKHKKLTKQTLKCFWKTKCGSSLHVCFCLHLDV